MLNGQNGGGLSQTTSKSGSGGSRAREMVSGGRALKLIPSIYRAGDRCRFLGLQRTPCARLEDRGTQLRGAPRSFLCAASTSSSGSDADVGIVVLAGGLTADGGVPKVPMSPRFERSKVVARAPFPIPSALESVD